MVAVHVGLAHGPATPELAQDHPIDLTALGTAAALAVVTHSSESIRGSTNVKSPVQTETQCLTLKQVNDEGKRFATLRAVLALQGYSLHHSSADDGPVRYSVSHWGLVRELQTIASVRASALQVGATHA